MVTNLLGHLTKSFLISLLCVWPQSQISSLDDILSLETPVKSHGPRTCFHEIALQCAHLRGEAVSKVVRAKLGNVKMSWGKKSFLPFLILDFHIKWSASGRSCVHARTSFFLLNCPRLHTRIFLLGCSLEKFYTSDRKQGFVADSRGLWNYESSKPEQPNRRIPLLHHAYCERNDKLWWRAHCESGCMVGVGSRMGGQDGWMDIPPARTTFRTVLRSYRWGWNKRGECSGFIQQ